MKKFFLIGLLIVAFAILPPLVGVDGLAGNRVAAATPEELKAQNLRDFEKWRADIPDYERRLYDRVKSINSRLVHRTNLILILIVVVALVLPFWMRRILGSAGGRIDGSASAATGAGVGALRTVQKNQEIGWEYFL